jgi:GNAT superfamily N-acetyltransferase
MSIQVRHVDVASVLPLRELHRAEMSCQITHDSFPARGFSDAYLVEIDGHTAGYGLVANQHIPNTVDEFYLAPAYRAAAQHSFRQLIDVSGAARIRAQTNDPLLLLMLYDFATNISSDTVLFADALTTFLICRDGAFRKATEADQSHIFEHHHEPVGEWLIETDGVVVATGGALFHYNPPYGDLFMEVAEPYRRRGFGSYLVQELKRACYEAGKVPAARCDVSNVASRHTLEKAGMLPAPASSWARSLSEAAQRLSRKRPQPRRHQHEAHQRGSKPAIAATGLRPGGK